MSQKSFSNLTCLRHPLNAVDDEDKGVRTSFSADLIPKGARLLSFRDLANHIHGGS
jgi:hypothetical protein